MEKIELKVREFELFSGEQEIIRRNLDCLMSLRHNLAKISYDNQEVINKIEEKVEKLVDSLSATGVKE